MIVALKENGLERIRFFASDGSYSRYAAIIVKQVDEKTRGKVSLNELLRIE